MPCSMTGCGGEICRRCQPILKRMCVERYPDDGYGQPDLQAQPETGRICAAISEYPKSRRMKRYYLPAIASDCDGRYFMTVAACSFPDIRKGDRIISDEYTLSVESWDGTSAIVRVVQ
ncbi:MAG: hypothetical protein E7546_06870 [Ruminococcaceae bacterium]|nr:hypothetical protein [Oscillospiraceae bacterium]